MNFFGVHPSPAASEDHRDAVVGTRNGSESGFWPLVGPERHPFGKRIARALKSLRVRYRRTPLRRERNTGPGGAIVRMDDHPKLRPRPSINGPT